MRMWIGGIHYEATAVGGSDTSIVSFFLGSLSWKLRRKHVFSSFVFLFSIALTQQTCKWIVTRCLMTAYCNWCNNVSKPKWTIPAKINKTGKQIKRVNTCRNFSWVIHYRIHPFMCPRCFEKNVVSNKVLLLWKFHDVKRRYLK